jgi:hypothetical protein
MSLSLSNLAIKPRKEHQFFWEFQAEMPTTREIQAALLHAVEALWEHLFRAAAINIS